MSTGRLPFCEILQGPCTPPEKEKPLSCALCEFPPQFARQHFPDGSLHAKMSPPFKVAYILGDKTLEVNQGKIIKG
jgi:hypothetical protein